MTDATDLLKRRAPRLSNPRNLSDYKIRLLAFSVDAILLAHILPRSATTPDGQILDLCSGTGVIPFLLEVKQPVT